MMRSAAEIRFRLRQEAANLAIWVRKPTPKVASPAPLPGLPEPAPIVARLRNTGYAADVLLRAGKVLDHRFDILGISIETGPDIHWRRDYVSGRETEIAYFRTIPYLDATRAGDHKVIWELNRHQHLVLLAQAYLFSRDRVFVDEIERQIASWLEQNPVHGSINWASALEVAFRALSWIWVWHLVGCDLSPAISGRLLSSLWAHGRHLEYNLSYYFSRNTHLLGEAVALHALGVLFPSWPNAGTWARVGARVVEEELNYQVLADGGYFEQASWYQVYAIDFFVLHCIVAGRTDQFGPAVTRMADYLDALLGVPRAIPLIGDDDGGRLFHPYGVHAEYGRATIATVAKLWVPNRWSFAESDLFPQAAWWVGDGVFGATCRPKSYEPKSRVFRDCGTVEMGAGAVQVLFDAGPFGAGTGGHSHSDTLSLVVRRGEDEILIDSGTFTYVGDPQSRNRFRSSAAHNTVRVDGIDQGQPSGPFGWRSKPAVSLRTWSSEDRQDVAVAECVYQGITHRRTVCFLKSEEVIFIVDDITAEGRRTAEQFWHLAAAHDVNRISIAGAAEVSKESGWRSRALGQKEPAPVVRALLRFEGHGRIAACIDCSANPRGCPLLVEESAGSVVLKYAAVTVRL